MIGGMSFYLSKDDFKHATITWILIGLNCGLFLIFNVMITLILNPYSNQLLISIFVNRSFYIVDISRYGFYFLAQNSADIMQFRRIWTLFTSIFIHVDILHLFSNMIALLIYGIAADRLFSKKQYLIVYILSGLIGSVFSLFFSLANVIPTIGLGASGAIFGLMIAVFVVMPKNMPYLVIGGLYLLYRVFGGGFNAAHIFGAVGGLFLGLYYKKKLYAQSSPSRKKTRIKPVKAIKRKKKRPTRNVQEIPQDLLVLQDLRDLLIIQKQISILDASRRFNLTRNDFLKKILIWQQKLAFHIEGNKLILDDANQLVSEIDLILDKWEKTNIQ